MNAAAQRRLTPVLGGIAAVFGVLLLLLLVGIGRGVHWGEPRPIAPLPETHDKGMPTPLPLSQFAAVWQQPLFNADRKPALRAGAGGANLGDLQLTGIILMPSLHMALLHEKSGDSEVRVREGETLPDGSWRLVELKPRSAIFESSTGRTELDLPAGAPIDVPKSASGEAQAAQPPPAGPPPSLPPGSMRMMTGPVPAQGGAMPGTPNTTNPPPASNDAQADRLRLLKEAIQKRRVQQSAAPSEGAH